MRLGGSVVDYKDPAQFVQVCRDCHFRAVKFPLDYQADPTETDAVAQMLREADIRIAEVGAWRNNPLSPDEGERRRSIKNCQEQLALAERLGADCCVNVAGTHASQWDAPSPDSFSEDVFAAVVDSVREIIDAVKPTRTFYTLETMPWMIPHTPDSYLRLMEAVDRPAFGVHLDIINMINSPVLFYGNAAFTKECFDKLGAYTKSIHVKDMRLGTKLTVHLDECLVGQGGYDLDTFLGCAARLHADMPVLVEHITNQQDYADSVRVLEGMLESMERR